MEGLYVWQRRSATEKESKIHFLTAQPYIDRSTIKVKAKSQRQRSALLGQYDDGTIEMME